jgi:murein DD-endopeptidase MepM/ murein hydrolase activator NlpD
MRTRARKSPLRHLVWIVPLLALDFFIFRWLALRQGGCHLPVPAEPAPVAAESAGLPPPPPPPVWQRLATPTPQQNLLNPDAPGVLQPTGSGRLESAKFGSTRTRQTNGHIFPAFHEGVDIAATARDRKGIPTDPVYAVAEGRVTFVNTVGGNSSYGKYVVVEHPDSSLGMVKKRDGTFEPAVVYTLYAHMADVRFGIRPGHPVASGAVLGTLGHTSSTQPPIPLDRSHLHWEVGVTLNSRFEIKGRAEKIKPDFGNYNGGNLFAFNPLDFFAAHSRDPGLTMAAFLATVPPACEVVLRGKTPDYFRRFPALWHGAPHDGGPIRLTLSESGAPLSGRNANAAEVALLGNQRQAVVKVFPDVLGRNGRGYVAQSSGKWQFTAKGRQWADLLFY